MIEQADKSANCVRLLKSPKGIQRASNRGVKEWNTENLRNLYPCSDTNHMVKKDNETGCACSTRRSKRNVYNALVGKPE